MWGDNNPSRWGDEAFNSDHADSDFDRDLEEGYDEDPTPGWRDNNNIDMQIANAAGIADERQVPSTSMFASMTLTCSNQHSHEMVDVDLDSLQSTINCFNNLKHFANCSKCEKGKPQLEKNGFCQWILDSGASQHFTNTLSDFSEYTLIKDACQDVQTAAKGTTIKFAGKGTVFLSYRVDTPSGRQTKVTCLENVIYIPQLSIRLLSMGVLLNNGFLVCGSSDKIAFNRRGLHLLVLDTFPHMPDQIIFWLKVHITDIKSLLTKSTIQLVDYDLWHKHFGHPFKQVLKEAQGHVKNFPKDLDFLRKEPICRSCTEGKISVQFGSGSGGNLDT